MPHPASAPPLQLESKRGSLLYPLLRPLGLAVFLPGEALIHWPQKLIYLEPMTIVLPSQTDVRDVKTLHLVADARGVKTHALTVPSATYRLQSTQKHKSAHMVIHTGTAAMHKATTHY